MKLENIEINATRDKKNPQIPIDKIRIDKIRDKLLGIVNSHETIPTEDEIKKNYVQLPNERITLLCSYTTRLEGFLDILLSGNILSSKDADYLLGKIHTHRGDSMSNGQSRTNYFGQNDYISFSTGFVSFKYSDPSIRSRNDYLGGYGFFIPLQSALKNQRLRFSHCSDAGGIKNYDLNRDNIVESTHKARKNKELFDDGFGNVFEVEFKALHDAFKNVLEYPKIPISHGILAIPLSEKDKIEKLLAERQTMYRRLVDDINKISNDKISEWQNVGDRELMNPKETKEYLLEMLKPVDLKSLPIFWYEQKNLDIALQYLSQK